MRLLKRGIKYICFKISAVCLKIIYSMTNQSIFSTFKRNIFLIKLYISLLEKNCEFLIVFKYKIVLFRIRNWFCIHFETNHMRYFIWACLKNRVHTQSSICVFLHCFRVFLGFLFYSERIHES